MKKITGFGTTLIISFIILIFFIVAPLYNSTLTQQMALAATSEKGLFVAAGNLFLLGLILLILNIGPLRIVSKSQEFKPELYIVSFCSAIGLLSGLAYLVFDAPVLFAVSTVQLIVSAIIILINIIFTEKEK